MSHSPTPSVLPGVASSASSWQVRLGTALALDLADFLLRGALGLRFGFPVGALVGLKLAHTLGWRDRRAWQLAALCGVYCMVPGTALLPIGTASAALALIVGAVHERRVRRARGSHGGMPMEARSAR